MLSVRPGSYNTTMECKPNAQLDFELEQHRLDVWCRDVEREVHRRMQTPQLVAQDLLDAGYTHSRVEWSRDGLAPTSLRGADWHLVLQPDRVPFSYPGRPPQDGKQVQSGD
jgi:hypothetical protein